MIRFLVPILLAGTWLLAGPARAQATPPAGSGLSSSSGSGPAAPLPNATAGARDRTGGTTAVGRTKPPGSPVGDRAGTTPELDRKSQALDRQITRGICKGC
ncbi:hypothetical protein [Enterovirga sp.]|jgi:hypothetical protein|uniref:hypothetical protein n=1 Tax=Enterovirga sp. TaxID=2026350 RepID=UPI002614F8C3|nr:hypothetical protein [Enterovirga sp.]MDB5591415.1 hypothetical protein [Enterovirga sp.]